jgi:hypothetical protein
MIFGGKSGRIGAFGKAVANSVFNSARTPAAAASGGGVVAAAPPPAVVDWSDFVDALAAHTGHTPAQASAVRGDGRLMVEGRLWTIERTGYFDNKLMLRAQLSIDLQPLPAAHLLGVMGAAAIAARLFGCALWIDDSDQTLQVSWHVGELARLSIDELVTAFDEARQVVDAIENALLTGLATDPSPAPDKAEA